MSTPADQVRESLAKREAAHAAWLLAASPPTPGNITLFAYAYKAGNLRQKPWDGVC